MAYENTMDDLYDDLEENGGDGGANLLIMDDLVDPDSLDVDDDDDEQVFEDEGDLLNREGIDLGDVFDDEEEEEPGDNTDIVIAENPVINEILAAKGIKDPKAIKYEDEAGEIQEVDFYSLPYEDQIEILKGNVVDEAPDFSEHELEVVNFLRTQNATLDDVIAYASRQAIEDYLRENSGERFVVDDYDDSELYIMDLKIKYEDLTDEDLQIELEKELQHEELFKKKVDKIRQEYIALEAQEKESKLEDAKRKEDQDFEQLTDTLVKVAVAVEDIGGITLQDDDKNLILSTVLEKDINGVSKFVKSLDDPQTLFELAWYAEKGKEAMEMIHDYYKKQIDSVSKAAFAKGKAEGSKGAPAAKTAKVSYTRTASTKGSEGRKYSSIDDLTP